MADDSPGRPRSGFTVVELLVAGVCAAVLLHMAVSAQIRITGSVREEIARLDEAASLRAAGAVLGRETRWTAAGFDWGAPSGDSVPVRAVRGTAFGCGASGLYAFEGFRAPNPVKDSVLVLGADGAWRASRLVGVTRRGACYEWRLDPEAGSVSVAILFEAGTYHLADETLRYRTGRGGRQPVTGPVGDGARLVTGASTVLVR